MFPGWLRRIYSYPRQLPIDKVRVTRTTRDAIPRLEQLEDRRLLSIGGLDLTFGNQGIATTHATDVIVVGTVIQSG
jgi:hypothetical protein